jgi:hypothetical protein
VFQVLSDFRPAPVQGGAIEVKCEISLQVKI